MSRKRLGMVFIVLGIGLFIFTIIIGYIGYNDSVRREKIRDKGTTVEATITRTWSETTSHNSKTGPRTHSTHYYCSAKYTYNGATYNNSKINLHSSTYPKANTITLYVDPDEPSYSFYTRDSDDPIGSLVGYAVFGVVAIVLIIAGVKVYKGQISLGVKTIEDYYDEKTYDQKPANKYDPYVTYSSDDYNNN